MDSSKRSLYKPAPVEHVGAKEQRRALAQGRLINESLIPERMTVYAAPSGDLSTDTVATISHTSSHFGDGSMTPPRQALANLSVSHQASSMMSDYSSPLPRSSQTHQYMTERSYSPPRSPSKPSPSDFLELSDSDREYVGHHRTPVKHITAAPGSPVLLVDASGRHRDQGRAEVEVRTANIASPAKVVCHAPSVVENDLKNTGYTEEAARVPVDSVPTVTVHSDAVLRAGISANPSEAPPSRLATRTHESQLPSQESSLASEGMTGNESTASTLRPGDLASLDGRHDSNLTNLSTESERPSSAMSNVDDGRGTKKKKRVKAKFVQSRYMQSMSKPSAAAAPVTANTSGAAAGTGSSRTTAGTLGAKAANISSRLTGSTASSRAKKAGAGRPTTSSSLRKPERTKSASHKSGPVRATSSFSSMTTTVTHQKPTTAPANRTQLSYTPVSGKGKRFASTPSANTSVLPNAPPINASAIAASTSMLGGDISSIAPADYSRLMPPKFAESRDHSRDRTSRRRVESGEYSAMSTSPGHDSAYSSLGHKQAKQLTQADLDVMYARYIQSAFLDTKMKKVIHDKEKEAMNQLHALWKQNDELSRKKTQLDMKLARLKHASMLDQQLQIQESGLGPVTSHLSQFRGEYSTLAHALDTTRHQIELTDIHVPQDQDGFHDTLERALNQSEHLLGEIAMATRAKQPKVVAFSSALGMLEQAVANESLELWRCQELLAATSSLATHETALRVQQIEERTAE